VVTYSLTESFPKFVLHRDSFVMIDSAETVQTSGFGFIFQACIYSLIAATRSLTLNKAARRLSVNSPNHRSTKFSHFEQLE
jgi:hypothetical protein